jgi:hypothetical protein
MVSAAETFRKLFGNSFDVMWEMWTEQRQAGQGTGRTYFLMMKPCFWP